MVDADHPARIVRRRADGPSDGGATVGRMRLPMAVTVALTSAEELRFMLERIDVTDAEHRRWVVWQAEMLHHWAGLAADEAPCFPALADGLAEFAATVAHRAGTTPN